MTVQQKQKEHYDKRHAGTSSIVVGSVVLAYTKNRARKGGKQDPLWLGPYIVGCAHFATRIQETLSVMVSLITLVKEKLGCCDKGPLSEE